MALDGIVQNTQASDGVVFGVRRDPVEFFRQTLSKVRRSSMSFEYWPYDITGDDGFLGMAARPPRVEGAGAPLMILLQYLPNGPGEKYSERLLPDGLRSFFSPFRERGEDTLVGFRLPSLSVFGEYAGNVRVTISWHHNFIVGKNLVEHTDIAETTVEQPSPGLFALGSCEVINAPNEPFMNGVTPSWIGAMAKTPDFALSPNKKFDYRPFVQRMLELFSKKSPDELHNPSDYWNDGNFAVAHTEISSFVQDYSGLIFDLSQSGLASRVAEQARLVPGRVWASVPKLSLGIKSLPSPAVNLDGYVVSGAPLMVELLSELGIMSLAEARATVAQRVANYVMRNTRFQHSPADAQRILASIK
ncbi:hypothetical protein HY640_04365 [Candidatus Woesearchaeota archaeon]|nr:hypothetical protein [Candidatus Woesearchaeota archaeon]